MDAAAEGFRRFREQQAAERDGRRCDQCGEAFQPARHDQRFCDSACRRSFANARGREQYQRDRPAPTPTPPPAKAGMVEELADAKRLIAGQAATILKLQQAITAAEKRAELAEEAVRRAYKGFASAASARR